MMSHLVEKPTDISPQNWVSVDIPEATDAEFATARPFKEVFPEQYEAWRRKRKQPLSRTAGEGAER